MKPIKALLALEDGKTFKGYSFTGPGEAWGEIVFNTSMSGYQEVLTDPSYTGQIVSMTYPHIGNYGVNPQDVESAGIQVNGFIVRQYHPVPSNWRCSQSLKDYLNADGILGLTGIDTRALTRYIREKGAMAGYMSTADLDPDSLTEKAKAAPSIVGRDLVTEVTTDRPYVWKPTADGGEPDYSPEAMEKWRQTRDPHKVIALDYGIKYNILRNLKKLGIETLVLSAHASAEEILSLEPTGIFLSNGPGDPEPLSYAFETVRALLGKKPIFGICMGHQILGQAIGGKTFKLKFGHRGINQPVKDLTTQKIEITSQNHGFAVDINTLSKKDVELTHINLNDNTLEGLTVPKLKAFSVQYHPEASPGPHDANYLFKRFLDLMKSN